MSLPAGNVFESVVQIPANGSQPTGSAWGVPLAGSGVVHTYGALTPVVGAADWDDSITGNPTGDAYRIEILLSTHAASATARNALVTVAIDGVDTFVNLAATKSGPLFHGGVPYVFDVHIPAGSVIAAKLQIGDAASLAATCHIAVKLYCDPTKPSLLRTGTGVTTLGADTANTLGTSIVMGAAAEGAWVKVGTLAAAAHAFDFGWMNNDTAINNQGIVVDVGIDPAGAGGSPSVVIGRDIPLQFSATEQISKRASTLRYEASAGDDVYVRAQGAGPEAGDGVIVYATTGRYTPPGVFTVSGTVSIATIPVGAGKTVQIFAVDGDGIAELVATALTNGSGAFSAGVPDNTRSYFASYDNDGSYGRSALGVPV